MTELVKRLAHVLWSSPGDAVNAIERLSVWDLPKTDQEIAMGFIADLETINRDAERLAAVMPGRVMFIEDQRNQARAEIGDKIKAFVRDGTSQRRSCVQ